MDSPPDIHVICLGSAWLLRGAKTMAFLEREIPADMYGSIVRFDAVTPADFVIKDVVSTSQLVIIRGKASRVTHKDMSTPQQVGCFMSHRALWQVCADSDQPIIVAEDDSRPNNVARRINKACEHHLQQPTESAPLVVLLQHHPCSATSFAAKSTGCKPVKSFAGAAMYYLNPAAARLLLAHSPLAEMHVDHYMSTCIAAYDLAVYSVPGAADQTMFGASTLAHSSLWSIITERQELVMGAVVGSAIVFLVWAIAATVIAATVCRSRVHR